MCVCVHASVFHIVSQNVLWKPRQKGACECGHHQDKLIPDMQSIFFFYSQPYCKFNYDSLPATEMRGQVSTWLGLENRAGQQNFLDPYPVLSSLLSWIQERVAGLPRVPTLTGQQQGAVGVAETGPPCESRTRK